MGKNIVHFRCRHCGHCCTDVVCLLTPWDANRIVRSTGLHPKRFVEFLTPEEVSGVEKSDPTWLECQGERYMMALRRDATAGCHFLDGAKRCTIYEARPILCRLYPFLLHEAREGEFKGFSLHKTGVECPRERDDVVLARPLYELWREDCVHQEDYAELVRVFNGRRDANKKPGDFIAMFFKEGRRKRG